MPACQQAPLSLAPTISVQQCQPITRCTLPAMAPRTNGELHEALDTAKGAWGMCAAKVDMIVTCQAKAQAKIDAEVERATHD
ncbi:Rz1-like lysis system protein LysC [Burkholderia ubonensis]|uniref:Rz1-like lysis system protein LysC n=1 Tax=Burkholderia ubonensis TaxID=101571 RepID=UPI001E640A7E|nr:Rz1-like lysis system protein LysC [Burkholderia ubonensis]